MFVPPTVFADSSSSGLASLGLNVKSFLFQLVTFVLVLLILRKWVFPVLVRTLDERQKAVEKSLDQATEAAAALKKTEKQIGVMLFEARERADSIIATSQKEAATIVEAAEHKAIERAEHIVSEARAQIQADVAAARQSLKVETLHLVAEATSLVLQQKIDSKKDAELIDKALTAVQKGAK